MTGNESSGSRRRFLLAGIFAVFVVGYGIWHWLYAPRTYVFDLPKPYKGTLMVQIFLHTDLPFARYTLDGRGGEPFAICPGPYDFELCSTEGPLSLEEMLKNAACSENDVVAYPPTRTYTWETRLSKQSLERIHGGSIFVSSHVQSRPDLFPEPHPKLDLAAATGWTTEKIPLGGAFY